MVWYVYENVQIFMNWWSSIDFIQSLLWLILIWFITLYVNILY